MRQSTSTCGFAKVGSRFTEEYQTMLMTCMSVCGLLGSVDRLLLFSCRIGALSFSFKELLAQAQKIMKDEAAVIVAMQPTQSTWPSPDTGLSVTTNAMDPMILQGSACRGRRLFAHIFSDRNIVTCCYIVSSLCCCNIKELKQDIEKFL